MFGRSVDVGARLEESRDRLRGSRGGGTDERRFVSATFRVHVGTGFERNADDGRVRAPEHDSAIQILLPRACFEEHAQRPRTALPCGYADGVFAARCDASAFAGGISACLNETKEYLELAQLECSHQRRLVCVGIESVHIDPFIEKSRHRVEIAGAHRPVQELFLALTCTRIPQESDDVPKAIGLGDGQGADAFDVALPSVGPRFEQ